jgi:hypothetical protein
MIDDRRVSRVTFQFLGRVAPDAGDSPTSAFRHAVQVALEWLQSSLPVPLSPDALTGHSFEWDGLERSVRCEALPEDGIWTARLVKPDAAVDGHPAVPGRTWTTDVSLVASSDRVRIGLRSICTSPAGANHAVPIRRPRLLRELARRCGLHEAGRIDGKPWQPATSEDLEELHALLTDPGRALPVLFLTTPSTTRLGMATREFLLDAELLADRTLGVAYVVTMPMALGFQWTDKVTKPWSAYLGSVRTYLPGLDFEHDSPFDHPMALAENVLATHYKGLTAEAGFLERLVDLAYDRAASRRVNWEGLPSLDDIRIRRAEQARLSAVDDSALVEGLRREVAALSRKIEGLKDELTTAVELAGEVENEKLALLDEVTRLRIQLDELRREFRRRTNTDPDDLGRLPHTFPEFEEWARSRLAGRLVLHPRALRGLRDATYEDPPLAARALLLLANEFRRMRLGERGANEAFEAGCQALGLRFSRSITLGRAGEEGETYFVRVGPGGRERRFLEFHLRKGTARDPRHCLAIYFFWDEGREQVVVGWMPEHLDTRVT